MHVYFECEQGKCMCYNCFYGFDILKQEDLKVYEQEGIHLGEGTEITVSLVSQVFQVCHKIFRRQYNLEPQSLQKLCTFRIVEIKTLSTDLLPKGLALQCKEFKPEKMPKWYPEWTVPSVLIRHLHHKLRFKYVSYMR